MRKVFCDKCEKEIIETNDAKMLENLHLNIIYKGGRTNATFKLKQIEKATPIPGQFVTYDICMHCIIDAVSRLDTRPRSCDA